MKQIIIVCSSGLGTSLMLKLNLERLLKEWNISASVVNMDKTSVTAESPDLIIGAKQIVESINLQREVEIIALENIVNPEYLRKCLEASKTIQDCLLRN
ncbi:PTS system ascorbate-specific IIB component [Evansella vedderi]|uniref:PTS system ascorbate-specific IIB component n=1 Tax=Evansella vedderi TaxID=38282 RepID=A0ABT9ZNW4_9BACI|nr:PTS sugar transporter subunit IIB [Evansella vedderi]MDQ0252928.1 PTS system ascorbate-specific IIB component [Evansella vedderi]